MASLTLGVRLFALPDPKDTSLVLAAGGGAATVRSLAIYELKSTWPATASDPVPPHPARPPRRARPARAETLAPRAVGAYHDPEKPLRPPEAQGGLYSLLIQP